MKFQNLGYWATTGLVAAAFAFGGVMDAALTPDVVAALAHLGYPAYFGVLIGVWKVLGAIVVLLPGLPRVKEWAYAGMFFDLTGAAVSHGASGDGAGPVLTPLVILALVAASYLLRPESRRLPSPAQSKGDGSQRLATA